MRGEVCWSLRKGVEQADERSSSDLLESQREQFSSEQKRTTARRDRCSRHGSWTLVFIAAGRIAVVEFRFDGGRSLSATLAYTSFMLGESCERRGAYVVGH